MDNHWVLVVEDEPDLCELVESRLSEEGFRVVSSDNLPEARAKVQNQKFSVIVLDLRLGNNDGSTLIQHIRGNANGFNAKTPILIMSGNIDHEVVPKIKGLVNYVLVKPIDPQQLVQMIRKFAASAT